MKSVLLVGLLLLAMSALGVHYALGDDENEHGSWRYAWKRTGDVASVRDPRYTAECGSCHMAYPPGLLPARSWVAMMSNLNDHFGDNAELDQETTAALTRYLVENSADGSDYRRSRQIVRTLALDAVPLRISELPYIGHEHAEIPQRMIASNPGVGSLSNCNTCHQRAQQGSFREREIQIPGYGRWDD